MHQTMSGNERVFKVIYIDKELVNFREDKKNMKYGYVENQLRISIFPKHPQRMTTLKNDA